MAKNDLATKDSSTAIAMVSNFEQDAASSYFFIFTLKSLLLEAGGPGLVVMI